VNANNDRSAPSGEASQSKPKPAWQPLTPRGVAAFAQASLARLLLVQTVVALLSAGSVMWSLHRAWFPTITEAVRSLPSQAQLRAGQLEWAATSPICLAEGRCLAIAVDLDHTSKARSPAHLQVEFGRNDLKVYSFFGYACCAYPGYGVVPLNQPEVGPWWGAWAPAILAITGALVVITLLAFWACLATVYFLPVWILAFVGDRVCSMGGSWRLAGASLMPGALLMCGAVFLYGFGVLDLLRLMVAAAVHLITGWVYLFASLFFLPRVAETRAAMKNPFA